MTSVGLSRPLIVLDRIARIEWQEFLRLRKPPHFEGIRSGQDPATFFVKYLTLAIFSEDTFETPGGWIYVTDLEDYDEIVKETIARPEKDQMSAISTYFACSSQFIIGRARYISWDNERNGFHYTICRDGRVLVNPPERLQLPYGKCQECFRAMCERYTCPGCKLTHCTTCAVKISLEAGLCPTFRCYYGFSVQTLFDQALIFGEKTKRRIGEFLLRTNSTAMARKILGQAWVDYNSSLSDHPSETSVVTEPGTANASVPHGSSLITIAEIMGSTEADEHWRTVACVIELPTSDPKIIDAAIGVFRGVHQYFGSTPYRHMGFKFPVVRVRPLESLGGRDVGEIDMTKNLLESLPIFDTETARTWSVPQVPAHCPREFRENYDFFRAIHGDDTSNAPKVDENYTRACARAYQVFFKNRHLEAQYKQLVERSKIDIVFCVKEVIRIGKIDVDGLARMVQNAFDINIDACDCGETIDVETGEAQLQIQDDSWQGFCKACKRLRLRTPLSETHTTGGNADSLPGVKNQVLVDCQDYFDAIASGEIQREEPSGLPFLRDLECDVLPALLSYSPPTMCAPPENPLDAYYWEIRNETAKMRKNIIRTVTENVQMLLRTPDISCDEAYVFLEKISHFVLEHERLLIGHFDIHDIITTALQKLADLELHEDPDTPPTRIRVVPNSVGTK